MNYYVQCNDGLLQAHACGYKAVTTPLIVLHNGILTDRRRGKQIIRKLAALYIRFSLQKKAVSVHDLQNGVHMGAIEGSVPCVICDSMHIRLWGGYCNKCFSQKVSGYIALRVSSCQSRLHACGAHFEIVYAPNYAVGIWIRCLHRSFYLSADILVRVFTVTKIR